MALLQIAEPGESPAPHQQKLAVGIDLGTTNSLVATVRSGLSVVINDELGRPLLPSVVHYHADGSSEVGYEPQARQALDPRNVIASVKRFMGRGIKDIAHRESMPYEFEDTPGMVRLRTAAGVKSLSRFQPTFSEPCVCAPKRLLGGNSWAQSLRFPPILTMRNGKRPKTQPNWPDYRFCAC